jgi:hypothetical protein
MGATAIVYFLKITAIAFSLNNWRKSTKTLVPLRKHPRRELKAICDKRNPHRLIALALAAMFALAGSAATAESSLQGENAKELERLLAAPAHNMAVRCSDRTPPRTPASAFDRYLMWNEIALDTTAIDHTPNPTNKYVSYSGIPPVSGNVSVDRAIAQAAHDTLVALYPGQTARLDAIFNVDIAKIQGSKAAIDAGAALVTQAANAIRTLRQNDGSALPEPRWGVEYFPIGYPNVQAGICQIDPISHLMVALGGNWPKVKPFVMTSADQFRAPPPPGWPQPPSLSDAHYKQAFRKLFA